MRSKPHDKKPTGVFRVKLKFLQIKRPMYATVPELTAVIIRSKDKLIPYDVMFKRVETNIYEELTTEERDKVRDYCKAYKIKMPTLTDVDKALASKIQMTTDIKL